MNQEKSHVLVLPRDNLGPEPWSEERSSPWLPAAITLAVLMLLACLIWVMRRRRRQRGAISPPRPATGPVTPDAQLLSLAVQARETLATRFGATFRARTTEEISSDAKVKEALGEDHFASLIRLLATADHWKFASTPANGRAANLLEELPQWSAWQEGLAIKASVKRPAGRKPSRRRAEPARD